jgi:ABC-type spermidine/putrescine transport system permease subunit II
VAGNGDGAITTFPMRIFNANKTEIPPQVHVIASFILFASVAIIAFGTIRSMRREQG